MKRKENTQAKCRQCQNMGIQALRSHVAGKKHLDITHKIYCFFIKSRRVENEENKKHELVA